MPWAGGSMTHILLSQNALTGTGLSALPSLGSSVQAGDEKSPTARHRPRLRIQF